MGLPIIDAAGGRVLGRVVDLLLHPSQPALVGLVVECSGLFRQRRFLPCDQIQSLGPGAVVATGELAGASPEGHSLLATLSGRRLFSYAGAELGVLYDLHFDPANRQLTQVEASLGIIEDAWHGKATYPASPMQIGEETIFLGGL